MKAVPGTFASPESHRQYYGDLPLDRLWREAALRHLRTHRTCERCGGGECVYVIGAVGDMTALCRVCFQCEARGKVEGTLWG